MSLNKINFYSFLAFLIWLPIPMAVDHPWAWFSTALSIGFITFGIICSYAANWNAFPIKRVLSFFWLLAPLVLFQVWTLFQLMPMPTSILEFVSPAAAQWHSNDLSKLGTLSIDTSATYLALLKGTIYTLFAFVSIMLIYNKHRVRLVLVFILLSGGIQALNNVILVQLDSHYSSMVGMKPANGVAGAFIYKGHLAHYLILCLYMGLGLFVSQSYLSESGSWHNRLRRLVSGMTSSKMFVYCTLIVLVVALVIAPSKTSNEMFEHGTIIGAIAALVFYKNKPRSLIILIPSLFIANILVMTSTYYSAASEIVDHALPKEVKHDYMTMWGMSLIAKAPLVGSGMDSFSSVFTVANYGSHDYYQYAHSDYIQFAVGAGVPATLMLGVSCLYGLFLAVKAMCTRESKILKGTAFGCVMAIASMVIQICIGFHLQPSTNAMMFILVLVLAGCSSTVPSHRRTEVQS